MQGLKKEIVRDFTMKFLLLLRNAEPEVYFAARIYNYSLHGMYLESDLSLLSGAQVNIWLSDLPESSFPQVDLAEVRWCEEIIGAVVLFRYGAGIQYRQPIQSREFPMHFQIIQGGAK